MSQLITIVAPWQLWIKENLRRHGSKGWSSVFGLSVQASLGWQYNSWLMNMNLCDSQKGNTAMRSRFYLLLGLMHTGSFGHYFLLATVFWQIKCLTLVNMCNLFRRVKHLGINSFHWPLKWMNIQVLNAPSFNVHLHASNGFLPKYRCACSGGFFLPLNTYIWMET